MTRIESFSVRGLAGRTKPVEYDLNPDINVLFGLNGTGKTTLLKVLYSALGNSNALLKDLPFSGARVTFFSQADRRSYTRSIDAGRSSVEDETEELEADESYLHLLRRASAPAGPEWTTVPNASRAYRCSYLTTARLTGDDESPVATRASGAYRGVGESQLDEMFASYMRRRWRLYTNRALSEVRGVQEAGLARVLQVLFEDADAHSAREMEATVAYRRANGFLQRQGVRQAGTLAAFRKRYDSDPRLRQVVEQIDAIERTIERIETPRRELQTLVRQFVGEGKDVQFNDADILVMAGEGQIPLQALSSGEKQLLRIMVEVIAREDSVVIIDEPELSLHIDWQRNLLRSLRTINPTVQLIVATHSPEIMADLPDSQILAV